MRRHVDRAGFRENEELEYNTRTKQKGAVLLLFAEMRRFKPQFANLND